MSVTTDDRNIFHNLLQKFRAPGKLPDDLGELLLAVGLSFLDTPYAADTLEGNNRERLVINLRQFDCYTFLENTLVLTRLLRTGQTSWHAYRALLKAARYRQGLLQGYASRLHYFTDWLHDNQEKGFLQATTNPLGGKVWQKNFNFMTAHRDQYPPLKSATVFRRLLAVEQACSARAYYYLPKSALRLGGSQIQNGDLIAINTSTTGLDVVHVGLAMHHKRGLRLLHASPRAGKVVLSDSTLFHYLEQKKSRLGIIVARAL